MSLPRRDYVFQFGSERISRTLAKGELPVISSSAMHGVGEAGSHLVVLGGMLTGAVVPFCDYQAMTVCSGPEMARLSVANDSIRLNNCRGGWIEVE